MKRVVKNSSGLVVQCKGRLHFFEVPLRDSQQTKRGNFEKDEINLKKLQNIYLFFSHKLAV